MTLLMHTLSPIVRSICKVDLYVIVRYRLQKLFTVINVLHSLNYELVDCAFPVTIKVPKAV